MSFIFFTVKLTSLRPFLKKTTFKLFLIQFFESEYKGVMLFVKISVTSFAYFF